MTNSLLFETAVRIVLFNSKDEILLQRICLPGKPQFYITPGGRVEEKERIIDAVERELLEETGFSNVSLSSTVPLFSGWHTMNRGRDQVRLLEHFFAARLIGKKDHIEESHQRLTEEERVVLRESKWVALDDLKRSELIFVPINLQEFAEAVLYGRDLPEIDFRDPPQFHASNERKSYSE